MVTNSMYVLSSYWTNQLFFPFSLANSVGAFLCRPVSGSTVPCFEELFAAPPHEPFLAAEVLCRNQIPEVDAVLLCGKGSLAAATY
jgi:hypothetical protein